MNKGVGKRLWTRVSDRERQESGEVREERVIRGDGKRSRWRERRRRGKDGQILRGKLEFIV